MMLKKFASQVTILVIVNLIIKLIWIFLIERNVQLKVGFEAYGLYYTLFNFTFILGVINDPGLSNYLIRFISGNPHTENQISQLFSLKIILSIIYLLFSFGMGFLLGFKDFRLLWILLSYQVMWSFLIYLRGFLKGHQLLTAEIIFSILDKVLIILALLPLFYLDRFEWNIGFYAMSQLIAMMLSIIICFVFLKSKNISITFIKLIKPNFTVLKTLLPFALFAFLVLAYNKIDTLMLAKMIPDGQEQTGTYAAAYRFLDASNMLPILFASLLYPIISKLIATNKNIEAIIKSSLGVLLSISLMMAFGAWFNREALMQLFYGESSSPELALVFGILLFSAPLIVIYYVFSTVFTANDNFKILNGISAFGLLMNILLNFFLIPIYGALGAAISSFFSFLLIGLMYVVFYYRYFKQSFDSALWMRIFSLALFLFILGKSINYLNINWVSGLGFFLVVATIVAFSLKLITIKFIKGIFNIQ